MYVILCQLVIYEILTGLGTAYALTGLNVQLTRVRGRTSVRIALWTAHQVLTIALEWQSFGAHGLSLRDTNWHLRTRFVNAFHSHKLALFAARTRDLITRVSALASATSFAVDHVTEFTRTTFALLARIPALHMLAVRSSLSGSCAT